MPIRGNVPARLARSRSGLDAVILAASGLRRLGLDDAITELLDPALFPPSPGQGALAVQVRAADRELLEMLNSFGDPDADAAVRAERAVLAELHGGCSVPVGALASPAGRAAVADRAGHVAGRARPGGGHRRRGGPGGGRGLARVGAAGAGRGRDLGPDPAARRALARLSWVFTPGTGCFATSWEVTDARLITMRI